MDRDPGRTRIIGPHALTGSWYWPACAGRARRRAANTRFCPAANTRFGFRVQVRVCRRRGFRQPAVARLPRRLHHPCCHGPHGPVSDWLVGSLWRTGDWCVTLAAGPGRVFSDVKVPGHWCSRLPARARTEGATGASASAPARPAGAPRDSDRNIKSKKNKKRIKKEIIKSRIHYKHNKVNEDWQESSRAFSQDAFPMSADISEPKATIQSRPPE